MFTDFHFALKGLVTVDEYQLCQCGQIRREVHREFLTDFTLCYVPMGLEAAMTVHLACSEVTMPALEMEMLCCSMASWILVLSASFIWRTEWG